MLGSAHPGADEVADSETVYRRIPPSEPWLEPPARITSANFKLRPGETGLSVYRKSMVQDPQDILSMPEAIPGSKLACARVADIRGIGLNVVPCPLPDAPAHAEIRGPEGKITRSHAKKLRDVFRICFDPSAGDRQS